MNSQTDASRSGDEDRNNEAQTLATLCARANVLRRSRLVLDLSDDRDASRPTRRLVAMSER